MDGTKGYQERDTYIEFKKLPKGKYYVYVEIDWDSSIHTQKWSSKELKNFSLNCYGAGET